MPFQLPSMAIVEMLLLLLLLIMVVMVMMMMIKVSGHDDGGKSSG